MLSTRAVLCSQPPHKLCRYNVPYRKLPGPGAFCLPGILSSLRTPHCPSPHPHLHPRPLIQSSGMQHSSVFQTKHIRGLQGNLTRAGNEHLKLMQQTLCSFQSEVPVSAFWNMLFLSAPSQHQAPNPGTPLTYSRVAQKPGHQSTGSYVVNSY